MSITTDGHGKTSHRLYAMEAMVNGLKELIESTVRISFDRSEMLEYCECLILKSRLLQLEEKLIEDPSINENLEMGSQGN